MIAISYLDIPGFPIPGVEGDAGRLVVGAIEGKGVALFQVRGHYYERGHLYGLLVASRGANQRLDVLANPCAQFWRGAALRKSSLASSAADILKRAK